MKVKIPMARLIKGGEQRSSDPLCQPKFWAFTILPERAPPGLATRPFSACQVPPSHTRSAMQSLIQKQKNIFTVAMVAALSMSSPRVRPLGKEIPPPNPPRPNNPSCNYPWTFRRTGRPLPSDDLAEAFASRLTDVFNQGVIRVRLSFSNATTQGRCRPRWRSD